MIIQIIIMVIFFTAFLCVLAYDIVKAVKIIRKQNKRTKQ